jgi:S1-C subfamily serine protease
MYHFHIVVSCAFDPCANIGNGRLYNWYSSISSARNAVNSLRNRNNSQPAQTARSNSSSSDQRASIARSFLPKFGTISLSENFTPDPYRISIRAGGEYRISNTQNLDPACTGYIDPNEPSVNIRLSASFNNEIEIYLDSNQISSSLLIIDPSGNWHCSNYEFIEGSSNPIIKLENPSTGLYRIWAGTMNRSDSERPAVLYITKGYSSVEPLNGRLELSSNFDPDPQQMEVTTSGTTEASIFSNECSGYTNEISPNISLTYNNTDNFDLSFLHESLVDTSLIVKNPDGEIFCNDDFNNQFGLNPAVKIENPMSGEYLVWIGHYELEDIGEKGTLYVTEIDLNEVVSYLEEESGSSQGLVGSGTGFLVTAEGHLITNHHVVESCNSLTFQLIGNAEYNASLLSANESADLALLKIETNTIPTMLTGNTSLNLGNEVIVFGFPLRGDLSSQGNLTTGIVSGLSGLQDNLNHFQISAQIQPGNSGGPVFNINGEIVGVVVSRANDEFFQEQRGIVPQDINFAIRSSILRSFLEANNVSFLSNNVSSRSLSVSDVARIARQSTGVINCYR